MESKERFDVEIKTDKVTVNVEELSKETALALVNGVLKDNPDDVWLQENLPACIKSFGFMGCSSSGNSISISGYMPRVVTNEMHTCGRRGNDEKNADRWDLVGNDKCCSFCGSMHPDRVLELVKLHGAGVIERTDKSYKWYIRQDNVPNASYGGIKYYRHHDTQEFIDKLNELIKNKG